MIHFASRPGVVAALLLFFTSAASQAAAPSGRYSISGAVVHDNKTGLDWQRAGSVDTHTYAEAIDYCSGGWRLPAIKELQSLLDKPNTSPTIDVDAFPGTQTYGYWSSTPFASDASAAWFVYFDSTGFTVAMSKTAPYYVRCVR